MFDRVNVGHHGRQCNNWSWRWRLLQSEGRYSVCR